MSPITNLFDPLYDPACTVAPPALIGELWKAAWIWYPGQLAAHLTGQQVRETTERCRTIAYPGNLRQPVSQVFFRRKAFFPHPTRLRWSTPEGRTRVFINRQEGDATHCSIEAPTGENELLFALDFCASLPCLLLEGEGSGSGAEWEASLDMAHWTGAECDPILSDPDGLPDRMSHETVTIPPRSLVKGGIQLSAGNEISLSAGEAVMVDFFHSQKGSLAFEVEGEGQIWVQPGESALEAGDSTPETMEQQPLPVLQCSGRTTDACLPERALRFAHIRTNQACIIKNLRFTAHVAAIESAGWFECSDEMLNTI